MAAPTEPRQSCADAGQCQHRKIPCLTCPRLDAPLWPAAKDTYTVREWLVCPLAVAAFIGLAVGFAYGVVCSCVPGWLY